ncbi:MAG: RND family transporter [Marinifilaceae bacterium]|jgi:predicted RND superfamily exporter protein
MKTTKINEWFGRRAKGIIRYRGLILLLFLFTLFAAGYGLKSFKIDSSDDNYFLEDDPMMVMTDQFKEIFGNDYFIGVLAETDNVFTKRNLELIRKLSNELEDSVSYADKITSLTDIEFTLGTDDGMEIVQIVPEEIPASTEGLDEIKQLTYSKPYVAERLVSKDGKLSWIVLKLMPFPDDWQEKGLANPEMLTGKEIETIIGKEEYKELHLKATGMPYVIYKKTAFFGKEFVKIMGLSILLAIIVLILATKSFRGVLIPLFAAISSIIIVYGIIGHIRYPVDMASITIPMLLALAIAIGYSIHVFSFFKRQLFTYGNRKEAVFFALTETGWPIFFTALTTIGALLSFLIIPVKMVQFIGATTAGCVFVTFFIIILVMPALLSIGKNRTPHPHYTKKGGRWLERKLEKTAQRVMSAPKTIIAVSAALAVILICGAVKVEPAFDIEKTMGRRIPYVKDILELSESELGSLYSYNLMIEFPENEQAKHPENLKKLDEIAEYAKTFSLTKRTTSILDILKDLNRVLNENREAFYTIPNDRNQVAQMLLLYENAGGTESEYWMDYDYKRLRLMVELNDFNSNEAEKELKDIQAKANQLFPNAKVSVVGNLPQFVTMMQYVVSGQVSSFFIALIAIAILLMVVFGSVKIGLIGLIPNIAPAITIGGIMGWTGMPLDMMTVTIIPMILGLAVDDTIHFINHGKLEFQKRGTYNSSIFHTFRTVGVALVLTTVIISASFLTYTTSVAKMYINLGILATAGMLAALLADFFITPILLKMFKIFGHERISQKPVTAKETIEQEKTEKLVEY